MGIINLFVAFLIGSQYYNTTPLKVVCSIYILFEFFILKRGSEIKISKSIWFLMLLFLVGALNSFIGYAYFDFASDFQPIFLRTRFFFFRLLFAFSIYLFFKTRSKKDVLKILFYSLILNLIASIIQLIIFPNERLTMLFSEPSAAGFFYCFILYIILANYKETKPIFVFSRLFVFLGLFIASKGQFFALILSKFFLLSRRIKFGIFLFITFLSFLFIDQILNLGGKLGQVINVINKLSEYGISGLSDKYKVWSTFVTRLSAIYVSFLSIFEYPFGIGFGNFHPYYLKWLKYSGTIISSIETDEMKQGTKYASPRSSLLEPLISCGLFFLIGIIRIFRMFWKTRTKKHYLFSAFVSLLVVSFLLELNPFFCYLTILLSLREKELFEHA